VSERERDLGTFIHEKGHVFLIVALVDIDNQFL